MVLLKQAFLSKHKTGTVNRNLPMIAEHSSNQLINELTTNLTTHQPTNQLTTCSEVFQEFQVSLS